MNRNHPLMEMSRRAKRAGLSFNVVSHGLKKENEKHIPAMEAEYNRFKPRRPA